MSVTTFDIMLPYYGDVPMMQTAVRSVLAQTDPDWRLTVVDDGQEPDVPAWFDGLGDARVRYLRNPKNLGVTGNFRRCVELAEHEYMTMMGCDDIMLPNYVSVMRGVLKEHPAIGMIQPGVQVIDGAGQATNTLVDKTKRHLYAPKGPLRRVMDGERLAVSLLRGNWLYFPSLCWRTETIQAVNFRPNLHVIQDLGLVIDLIQRGEKLVVEPEPAFRYRRHAVSESALQAFDGRRFLEERQFFLDVADRMQTHGWSHAARVARLHVSSRLHALTMMPTVLRAGNRTGMRTLARHAFTVPRRPN